MKLDQGVNKKGKILVKQSNVRVQPAIYWRKLFIETIRMLKIRRLQKQLIRQVRRMANKITNFGKIRLYYSRQFYSRTIKSVQYVFSYFLVERLTLDTKIGLFLAVNSAYDPNLFSLIIFLSLQKSKSRWEANLANTVSEEAIRSVFIDLWKY